MRIFTLFLFLVTVLRVWADNPDRKLTLEDIYQKQVFAERYVDGFRWMRNDNYYTTLKQDDVSGLQYIIKYETLTGRSVDTLYNSEEFIATDGEMLIINDYSFGPNEQKVLLSVDKESIYRRSSKAFYYVYDLQKNEIERLTKGRKESYATFSPDGKYIAFVRNNNLILIDINTAKVRQVTHDGLANHIINGMGDWVYEEEFSLSKAFYWSPDGKRIAFFTFDETQVKEYNMQLWGGLYPKDFRFKYPKAGEHNSKVSISVFCVDDNSIIRMDTGEETDIYIPRIKWLPDGHKLSIIRMNRLQNKLEILHANVKTGRSEVIYLEKSETYVDLNYTDDLTYLSDGSFVKSSERDGYKHIYYYADGGKLIGQITTGNWEVSDLIAVDEKRKMLYFVSTEYSPLERHLYKISLTGKRKTRISKFDGVNHPVFSSGASYFLNRNNSSSTPTKITLHKSNGDLIRILEDNKVLQKTAKDYGLATKEFFSFITIDSVHLNGYMLKPADFDPLKQYPVLMEVYGGPGSQNVQNSWGHQYWHHLLTQKGYIIVSVDNRGTGGRGRAFKHCTYKNLGKLEAFDQIQAAKYLGALPFVDAHRIGIWGWSYGGYMSALVLFKGHEYFKTAISVAPVTSWRFYNTIYTERYLQRPQDNPDGYDDYTPLAHASELTGAFFLIHGTGDDNVHFQNSIELQRTLILAGKQFKSLYFPDKKHGISGGNSSYYLFKMMTDFILKEL